jgi:hypothetical protein
MNDAKRLVIDSPIGKQEVDSAGSPVGVTRMDVDKSYAGVGELLQDYINNFNQESWDAIKAKSDPSLILTARFEGGKEIWP